MPVTILKLKILDYNYFCEKSFDFMNLCTQTYKI
jgi:hypothetical protein